MNAKQTIQAAPTIATIAVAAPQLLFFGAIGCGIYFGLKWLFSGDNKPEKQENSPLSVAPELPAIRPLISAGNIIQKRNSPPVSARNSALIPRQPVSVSAPVPAMSVPAVPKIPVQPSAIPAAKIQPEIPPMPPKKIISREDMAKIFNGGRGLTRKSAVSALKALGYGKTAAYQALEIDGRFAPWLQFAPDGIITWKISDKNEHAA